MAEYTAYLTATKQDVAEAAGKVAALDRDKNGSLSGREFIVGMPEGSGGREEGVTACPSPISPLEASPPSGRKLILGVVVAVAGAADVLVTVILPPNATSIPHGSALRSVSPP